MSIKLTVRNRFQIANADRLTGMAVASAIAFAGLLTPAASIAGDGLQAPDLVAAADTPKLMPAGPQNAASGSEIKLGGGAAPRASEASDELLIGDKIQISFFEQLDLGQGADAGMTADVRTFYQRLDLTGEHVVDAGGSVTIPLLGRFVFAGLTADEARVSIMDAYKRLMGKSGEVNIAIIDRKSVFVTGIVKSPGAFRYEPGMIAVQAIALAGGYDREAGAAQRLIDAQRERERHLMSVNRLESLQAKRIRLARQRDLAISRNDTPTPDKMKVEPVKAGPAMEGELRLLEAEIAAKSGTALLEESRMEGAKSQISALKSLGDIISKQIGPRTERMMILQKMQGRGISTIEVLWNAQKEVADLQMQQKRLTAEIDLAEHNASAAEVESANAKSGDLLKIERELVSVDEEIRQQKDIAAASEAMINSLVTATSGARLGEPLRVKIMRRNSTRTIVLNADEASDLRPGDVVKVEVAPEGELGSANDADSL